MMRFFDRFLPRPRGDAGTPSRDPSDDFWFEPIGRRTASGVQVTTAAARQLPPVRACLKLLGDSVAGLGFAAFARTDDDERRAVRNHPLSRLLHNPNRRDTSFEFFANMVDDLAAEGMFLAEWRDPMGARQSLWRIPRAHYTVEELPDGRRFRVRRPGQAERVLLDDEVWFIAVPPYVDGVNGNSVILHDGREAIGAALALQAYGARFFENDATPPFVFKHKGFFADEASKANFLDAWRRKLTGRNRHKPGILEYGIELQQLAATNEASQFLETRKELWLDIARLWHVPPHKVGMLDKATFSNIEHQSLEFVTDTLGPWLELIERSAGKTFDLGDEFFFEFNVASLLRGDIKARFDAYAVARQWGWLSVNEIRRLENRNGIGPAGDRYIEPLNMMPAGSPAGAREESDATQRAVAFLRKSVAANGGRPNLRIIRDAA